MINYLEDPLLFNEKNCNNFFNVNELIKMNNKSIILNNKILNFYSAFVKSVDFSHINKSIFCNISIEYLDGCLNYELKKENYLNFRKYIAIYCKVKKIRMEMFNNWKKKNTWPFFILRVISLMHKNDKKVLSYLIKNINYFSDVKNITKFKPPKYINELLNERYSYFSGCCLGDGGFSNQNYWLIVDGSNIEKRIRWKF